MDILQTIVTFFSELGTGMDASFFDAFGAMFVIVVMVALIAIVTAWLQTERGQQVKDLWSRVDDFALDLIIAVEYGTVEIPAEIYEEADQLDIDFRMLFVVRQLEERFNSRFDFVDLYMRAERIYQELRHREDTLVVPYEGSENDTGEITIVG